MPVPKARWSKTGALLVGALAAAAALTACDGPQTATVTHIVDGDTIDVERDGEEQRVRLLNIDTPESTDPDIEPECLGPEATDYLESLIPIGTEVRLETDEELEDQYGRLLAGVYLEESLVNAEIARAGLGVAVVYEPNERFYDDVLGAQEEARKAQRGLHDPVIGCTVPGQVEAIAGATEALTAAAPADDASLEVLESYAEQVTAALATALALEELFDGDRSRFPLLALTRASIDVLQRSVSSTATELDQLTHETQRVIAAEEARVAAEEETRRLEVERRAEEEDARRLAEEAERRAAEEARAAAQATGEAAEQRAQEQRQPEPQRADQPPRSGSSSGSSGGADGYTGCRAYGGGYAPNAVDDQGRPYTKIDCTTKTPIG